MRELRIGCFSFRFRRVLDGIAAWELKKLAAPGGPARNPAFAYAWLRQHNIGFVLSFRYDRTRTFRENLSQLEHPWMLRRLMDAYDDEVMVLPLDRFVKKYQPAQEGEDST